METSKKRVPKGDLKLSMTLNSEQKQVASDYYQNDINIITSDFGCGKSSLACYLALQSIQKRMVEKVVFCRPVLKNKTGLLGFLPGNLDEKLDVFISHLKQILYKIYKQDKIDNYIEKGVIEFFPLELAKGYNFDNTLLILDETQDIDIEEFRNILSRLGKGSKAIILASEEQIDRSMRYSCIHTFKRVENDLPTGVVWNKLTINHRNDKMYSFIKLLDKYK